MHLAPKEVLHVYEGGVRRAEVQRVDEQWTPYRVVYTYNGRVLRPDYCEKLESAIEHAKRYVFTR